MNLEIAVRRSQIYRFLADAFLYPTDNWLEDLPLLEAILKDLGLAGSDVGRWDGAIADLPSLQAEHRRVFGLTGSLCYETELGLPHEFRQSQELADIAGFYRAFGFGMGGRVRERPDHLAAELEFMHGLALKEAWAYEQGIIEQAEVCADAQRKFLEAHLGRWIEPLTDSLARLAKDGPYVALARFAADFIRADADRLGAHPAPRLPTEMNPTPLAPDLACGDCPIGVSP